MKPLLVSAGFLLAFGVGLIIGPQLNWETDNAVGANLSSVSPGESKPHSCCGAGNAQSYVSTEGIAKPSCTDSGCCQMTSSRILTSTNVVEDTCEWEWNGFNWIRRNGPEWCEPPPPAVGVLPGYSLVTICSPPPPPPLTCTWVWRGAHWEQVAGPEGCEPPYAPSIGDVLETNCPEE